MYKKTVKKYHRHYETITDREKVITDFLLDMSYCKPVNVTEYKTRLKVFFTDSKFSIMYTLPIEYKKYINN